MATASGTGTMLSRDTTGLTASTEREMRLEALRRGANDFLNKPIDPSELAPRVGNLLALKGHQDELKSYSSSLEEAVRRI